MTLKEGLIGLVITLFTTGLLAWIGWTIKTWIRLNIVDPVATVAHRVDVLRANAEATAHLVSYHMGPNGGSPKLCDRLTAVETNAANVAAEVKAELGDRADHLKAELAERLSLTDQRMGDLHDAIEDVRESVNEIKGKR